MPNKYIIVGIAFAVIFAVIGFIFIFSHDIITEQDAFRVAIAEAVKESGVEGIIGDVYSMIDEIAPVVGVLFIIMSPVGLVIFILQAVMMKGLARYIKMLAGVVDGKEFDTEMKIPTGLLWTFGVIEAIRVASTVFVAPISGAVSAALAGYLILNAIMLKNIANEMAAVKKHIESERGILFNITEASDRRLQEMDSAE